MSKRGSSIVPLSQRSDELLNAINKAAALQMCVMYGPVLELELPSLTPSTADTNGKTDSLKPLLKIAKAAYSAESSTKLEQHKYNETRIR